MVSQHSIGRVADWYSILNGKLNGQPAWYYILNGQPNGNLNDPSAWYSNLNGKPVWYSI